MDETEEDERYAPNAIEVALRLIRIGVSSHRWLCLFTWLLAMGYGIAFTTAAPSYYESWTKIYVSSAEQITAELTGGRKPRDDTTARGLSEAVLNYDNLLALTREAKLVQRFPSTRTWALRAKDRLMKALIGPYSDETMERIMVSSLRNHVVVTFEAPATIAFSVEWVSPDGALTLVKLVERNYRATRKAEELAAIDRATAILEGEVRKTHEAIARSSAVIHESDRRPGVKPGDTGKPTAVVEDSTIRVAQMNLSAAELKAHELLGRLDSARMDRATAESDFDSRYSIIDPPELPLRPSKPKKPLWYAATFLISILLAVLVPVVRFLGTDHPESDPDRQVQTSNLDAQTAGDDDAAPLPDSALERQARSGVDGLSATESRARAFFAYPSRPATLAETMRIAAKKLNLSQQFDARTWEDLSVGGKLIIDEIRRSIESTDLLIADLTGLNPNVLFEVGYAIAKRKRVWLLEDRARGERGIEGFPALSTLGFTRYSNSSHIVDSLMAEKPHMDMQDSLYPRFFSRHIVTSAAGYFYLKSEHETETSVQLTEGLHQSSAPVVSDDPSENWRPLGWYGSQISRTEAVVWHLTEEGSPERHALHALVVGLAVGLDKQVLILCDGPVLAPLDYRHLARQYQTAAAARQHLDAWLESRSS